MLILFHPACPKGTKTDYILYVCVVVRLRPSSQAYAIKTLCHLVRRTARHKVDLTLCAPRALHKVHSTLCAHQFSDLVRYLVRTLCALVRDLVRNPALSTR